MAVDDTMTLAEASVLLHESRPGLPDTLQIREVAQALGCSVRFVERRGPGLGLKMERNPLTNMPFVRRVELMRFMLAHDYSPEIVRPMFQPAGGLCLVVGAAKDLRRGLYRCDPTHVPGALRLGMRLRTDPCWVVVLDFMGLGRQHAMEVAAELRGMGDCPLLVAAAGEDEPIRPGNPVPLFDLVVGRPIVAEKMAEALNVLRRSVLGSRPTRAGASGRVQRAGKKRRRK